MAEQRKRSDPTTPGQNQPGVDPSGRTRGTESSDLGNNPPSAFKDDHSPRGRDLRSTAAARDSRDLTFRCADVGHLNCNREIKGQSTAQMLPEIERHGREQHNVNADENTRSRILDAIHRRLAA